MRQENPDGERDAQNSRDHELPGPFHRDDREHPNAKAREQEINRAFNRQAPADESDDNPGKTMPDRVERHNESAEREMDERIEETADFAFLAEGNKELHPDARLE